MVEGDKLGDLDFLAPKGVKRNFHVVDFIASISGTRWVFYRFRYNDGDGWFH